MQSDLTADSIASPEYTKAFAHGETVTLANYSNLEEHLNRIASELTEYAKVSEFDAYIHKIASANYASALKEPILKLGEIDNASFHSDLQHKPFKYQSLKGDKNMSFEIDGVRYTPIIYLHHLTLSDKYYTIPQKGVPEIGISFSNRQLEETTYRMISKDGAPSTGMINQYATEHYWLVSYIIEDLSISPKQPVPITSFEDARKECERSKNTGLCTPYKTKRECVCPKGVS